MSRRTLLASASVSLFVGLAMSAGCGSDDSVQNEEDGGSLDGGRHDATVDGSGATDAGKDGTVVDGGKGSGDGSTADGGKGSGDGATADGAMGSGDGATADGATGSGDGSTADAAPSCRKFSDVCASNADCCSNVCDAATHTCASSIAKCAPAGGGCAASTDCCSLVCAGGACGASQCVSDNQACTASADCCSGTCGAGSTCTPLNTTCKTAGNTCSASSQCCSGLCDATSGTCALASSFCIQPGDICARDNDCCTGICSIDADAGATVGTCVQPPNLGGSNCTGSPDGVLCTSCGGCCSALCAPYATGLDICQPANGCHVEGDLCRADSDCCNTNPNGGTTGVTCMLAPGYPVGYCSGPNGCRPLGDTCHYLNYTCGNSSKADDCCAVPNPSNKICELDPLGVPRCAVSTCVGAGQACSNSLDCCTAGGTTCGSPDGGVATGCTPCIPGPNGTLVCAALNPDGGVDCRQGGQTCTINADCCAGEMCVVPPGGTQGLCSVTTPPPVDAGAGIDSGTTSGDGGTTSGDSGGAVDAFVCSLYGQSCTQSGDCCNGVPCTFGSGACKTGETGCTCINPIF